MGSGGTHGDAVAGATSNGMGRWVNPTGRHRGIGPCVFETRGIYSETIARSECRQTVRRERRGYENEDEDGDGMAAWRTKRRHLARGKRAREL